MTLDGGDMDTETLLAMLSSLLHPREFEETVLLEAIVNSQGDIEAAARSLQLEPPKKRRKVSGKVSIHTWLEGKESSSVSETLKDDTLTHHYPKPHSTIPPDSPEKDKTNEGSSSCVSISPCKKPTSRVKTVTNSEFMALLRPPNSSDDTTSKLQLPRLPPLTLSTPEMVAEHTPCTMHYSVLPPELACRLFHTLLHASKDWPRGKWWLVDRIVESSHSTSFFVRSPKHSDSGGDLTEAAQYWYNGVESDPPPTFPAAMEEACQIVEKVVNAEMRKRERFPLEWGGYPPEDGEDSVIWRANVAASNCFSGGKESLGFHSDQLTYLGPYPTIASMSLGVSRIFRLREVIPLDEKGKRAARTYNIPLRHNSLAIMHASTQEVYKHAIPPQQGIDMFHPPFPPPPSLTDDPEERARLQEATNARINITFRFYRPDFAASTTPKCKCGVPCILRPDMKNRYEDLSANPRIGESPKKPVSSARSDAGASSSKATKRTLVAKYWWTCYAGVQNDGKGCGFWKVMDVKAEGRGPFVGDTAKMDHPQ